MILHQCNYFELVRLGHVSRVVVRHVSIHFEALWGGGGFFGRKKVAVVCGDIVRNCTRHFHILTRKHSNRIHTTRFPRSAGRRRGEFYNLCLTLQYILTLYTIF